MIEIREQGSIFDCGADAVVVPVNCMGVAGKGVALEAKRRWPDWFKRYNRRCLTAKMMPGDIFVSEFDVDPPRYIIAAATKGHWRAKSTMLGVAQCIAHLRAWALKVQPNVLAIPALGCGLGGLDWNDVRENAKRCFDMSQFQGDITLRTTVLLFAPQ